MKHIFRLLLFAISLVACEQEVYETGDNKYSLMRADFVDAIVGDDKTVNYVLTDDNEQLPLATPFMANWIQRADTTYRAVMYYNQKAQKAEVLSMKKVSTVIIHRSSDYKSGVKTDPLNIESMWLSNNKKYLNLCLVLKTGATADDTEQHSIGIVGDTIITAGADSMRTASLRLYHRQGNVPQYYSQRIYFSVLLANLSADSLRLTINTYDGPVVKSFRIR